MIQVQEVRRSFYADLDLPAVGERGISIIRQRGKKFLSFEKRYFPNEDLVKRWCQVRQGEKILKTGETVFQKQVVTDQDLEKLNEYSLKELTKEEIVVYKLSMANNKIDRDQERFSEAVLDSFARTLPGKSFLLAHDRWSMPSVVGLYYDAKVDTGNGESTLIAWVYLLKTETELIQKVDAGIWRYTSIGFTAPVFMAITDKESGKVLYFEYQNSGIKQAEALEGSLVWLGAQYGTQVQKHPGEQPAAVGPTGRNRRENVTKHPQGGMKAMKIKVMGKEIDVTVGDNFTDEQIVQIVGKEYEREYAASLETEKVKIKKDLDDAMKTEKDLLEKSKKQLELFVETVISGILKNMAEFVPLDDAEKKAETERLKALDPEKLDAEKNRWEKKVSEKSGPKKPATDPTGKTEDSKEDKEVKHTDSFQAPVV